MSRKSERLVNLTIALLATKRYLTKGEIYQNVAGYSGDSDAKDRMFERDKDDLRSLGIEIELGTFDPLFEDEAGYRIKPESYALQLRDLDSTSVALLSQAARLWREAALGESAQTGLRKLKGLGIDSDLDAIVDVTASVASTPEQLPEIIEAVSNRKIITFEYFDANLNSEVRNVEPYRLSNSRGFWYLIGFDRERKAIRTFRVDRFASSVTVGKTQDAFTVDIEALDREEAQYAQSFSTAVIAIRKGKAPSLRAEVDVSEINADWDRVEIAYRDSDVLLQKILWLGTDAQILEPQELRAILVARLEAAVANHG